METKGVSGGHPDLRRDCGRGRLRSRDPGRASQRGLGLRELPDDLHNHIATLRSKLEPNPSEPRYLLTVHGMGYKFLV